VQAEIAEVVVFQLFMSEIEKSMELEYAKDDDLELNSSSFAGLWDCQLLSPVYHHT